MQVCISRVIEGGTNSLFADSHLRCAAAGSLLRFAFSGKTRTMRVASGFNTSTSLLVAPVVHVLYSVGCGVHQVCRSCSCRSAGYGTLCCTRSSVLLLYTWCTAVGATVGTGQVLMGLGISVPGGKGRGCWRSGAKRAPWSLETAFVSFWENSSICSSYCCWSHPAQNAYWYAAQLYCFRRCSH